jgi:REP element-mobilizing transposase RayT
MLEPPTIPPRRKSPRHPALDYTLAGYWHIIICTHMRRPLLGQVEGAELLLSPVGNIVVEEMQALPAAFDGLDIDIFRPMPDHLHAIFFLNGLVKERPSVPTVVQRFKSLTTRGFVQLRKDCGLVEAEKLWLRSFRDRYIRSEAQLHATREYILNNALSYSLKRG